MIIKTGWMGVEMGNRGKTTHSPNLSRLNCAMGMVVTIELTDASESHICGLKRDRYITKRFATI